MNSRRVLFANLGVIVLTSALALGQNCLTLLGVSCNKASAAGTWTFYQHTKGDNPAGCNASLTCSLTITSTGSGHVGIMVVGVGQPGSTSTYSSMTCGTGTWVNNTASSGHAVGVGETFMIYNLTLQSGITTCTVTLATATPGAWGLDFIEAGWSGSSVTYDTGAWAHNTCTAFACPGEALTLTGTSDLIIQSAIGDNGTCTAINGAYTQFFDTAATTQMTFAGAKNTATGTAPSWTNNTTGDDIGAGAIALKGS